MKYFSYLRPIVDPHAYCADLYSMAARKKATRSFFWFMSGLITVWIYLHYGQAHPVIAVLPGYQYDLAHHCHDVHSSTL